TNVSSGGVNGFAGVVAHAVPVVLAIVATGLCPARGFVRSPERGTRRPLRPPPSACSPEYMPAELWAGVEEAVTDDLDYRALIRRSMAPEEVPEAEFRARVAVAQQGTPNQALQQTGAAPRFCEV